MTECYYYTLMMISAIIFYIILLKFMKQAFKTMLSDLSLKPVSCINYRPLDKTAKSKIIFLTSQPKHMLWVLEKNISLSTQNKCLN